MELLVVHVVCLTDITLIFLVFFLQSPAYCFKENWQSELQLSKWSTEALCNKSKELISRINILLQTLTGQWEEPKSSKNVRSKMQNYGVLWKHNMRRIKRHFYSILAPFKMLIDVLRIVPFLFWLLLRKPGMERLPRIKPCPVPFWAWISVMSRAHLVQWPVLALASSRAKASLGTALAPSLPEQLPSPFWTERALKGDLWADKLISKCN